MKRSKFAVGLTALLVGLVLSSSAMADREVVADDTSSSDSPNDIASIAHAHGPTPQILRHEVHFDGDPDSVSERVSLFFKFRSKDGQNVWRELAIRTNPDGGLYGAFMTRNGRVTGYTRAWMQGTSTLVVEFSIPALGRPRGERYRWYVRSILGAGEFDEPCVGEDEGPPVCKDRAPAEGTIVHRL